MSATVMDVLADKKAVYNTMSLLSVELYCHDKTNTCLSCVQQSVSVGTKSDDNSNIVTSGGRVLAVTALADTMEVAVRKAYAGMENIHFDGMHFRKDIAHQMLNKVEGKSADDVVCFLSFWVCLFYLVLWFVFQSHIFFFSLRNSQNIYFQNVNYGQDYKMHQLHLARIKHMYLGERHRPLAINHGIQLEGFYYSML